EGGDGGGRGVVRALADEVEDLGVGQVEDRALGTGEDGRVGRRSGAVALLAIELERVLSLRHVADEGRDRAGAATGAAAGGCRAGRGPGKRLGGRGRAVARAPRGERGEA